MLYKWYLTATRLVFSIYYTIIFITSCRKAIVIMWQSPSSLETPLLPYHLDKVSFSLILSHPLHFGWTLNVHVTITNKTRHILTFYSYILLHWYLYDWKILFIIIYHNLMHVSLWFKISSAINLTSSVYSWCTVLKLELLLSAKISLK